MRPDIVRNLRSGEAQKGAEEKTSLRPHAFQTGKPAAPEEVQQDALSLVALVMSGQDIVAKARVHQLLKAGIAKSACGVFQRQPLAAGKGRGVHPEQTERDLVLFTVAANKVGVFSGAFSPDPVFHVNAGQRKSQLPLKAEEKVQKSHGVLAARNGGAESARTVDEL